MNRKDYVEIYEGMDINKLAIALNKPVEDIISAISSKPSFDDLIAAVQLYDLIPICLTNTSLLKITLEAINQNDLYTPCVSIMGHINHGKSTLVEALTSQAICSKEAGNITQGITLYTHDGFNLLDTPGHAALDNMRDLCIPLTEIIIIVIAANVGVQEQTIKIIEATNHKNRIMCINKIDIATVSEEAIYEKCARHGFICNEYNDTSETPVVRISAKNRKNVNELIQEIKNMISKQKYKTDIYRPALGYIIDAFVSPTKGRVIRVLLKAGACKIGDVFCINGQTYTIGRMFINGDQLCKKNEFVIAGNYVDISCDVKCMMGEIFFVVNNKKLQNAVCSLQINHQLPVDQTSDRKFMIYIRTIQQYNLLASILPKNSIVRITMTNNVTRDDISIAKKGKISLIIWYKINPSLEETLQTNNIEFLASDALLIGAIYDFLSPKKEDIQENKIIGIASVKAIFHMKNTVIGCDVKSGKIPIGSKCNIKRGDEVIGTGLIRSLQHNRKDIEEAKMGTECGIILKESMVQCEVGDLIEAIE